MAHSRRSQQPQYHYSSVSREVPMADHSNSNPYQNPYLTQPVTAQSQNPYSRNQYASDLPVAPAMSHSSSTGSNSSSRTASSMASADSSQPAYYSHPSTQTFTDSSYQQQRQRSPSHAGQDYMMAEQSSMSPSRSSRGAVERSGSRYVCMYPHCESSFSRSADLSRHYPTVHFPDTVRLNCPKPKCSRKGEQGFTRQDHLTEHLRQYHKEPVAKRRSSKSSASRPDTYR
ncbi:hypothetical protein FQN55_009465 [Onygenales sp. PD_40]|nr:hypothetical protein FQN55_009465 [Onygenales sp. PD_40]KAK2770670.1 hypothetical protein FQN53_005405 [Emmonsiellopsis sp. PD_33]KAK2785248.1 hypothetical protein FQN52_008588 [Onygenales sp. PD_12]KAK2794197.1 hypothetical protein FQN51_000898 [Onygenales sp. PD_10]